MKLDVCTRLINEIGLQIKAGKRYDAGQEYGDILEGPYKCSFREVQRRYYRDYLGFATWFYESDPFPVTQCFWPDKRASFRGISVAMLSCEMLSLFCFFPDYRQLI
jgi:Domain of unknown function (DUF4262)